MIPLPDPLHPATTHFPVAFLILGAAVAVVAVFVRRWNLPLLAAILLVAGAAGAVVAVNTGKEEEEKVEHAVPAAEGVLESHEEWGENARNAGIIAAFFAVAAFFAGKPVAGRVLSAITAVVALNAAYCVAQAGHFGGELVYRHGAGVSSGAAGSGQSVPAESFREERGEHDE